jgi:hypothetical protein
MTYRPRTSLAMAYRIHVRLSAADQRNLTTITEYLEARPGATRLTPSKSLRLALKTLAGLISAGNVLV